MSAVTVLLMVVLNMTAFRASKVIVSLFAIELGAPQFIIGIMIALYSLLPALLALQAGRLTDRLGVRLPMQIGSLGVCLSLLVPWLSPSLPALYVSAALIGVAHMTFNVATQNLLGSIGGAEGRTRNFANFSLAMAIGGFAGPMTAGLSIDHFGHASSYLFAAAAPLLTVCILLFARDVGIGQRVKSEEEQAVLSTSLLANPLLRRTMFAGAMAITGQDLFQFYMPIYGHSIGLSASAIGVVLAMFGIAAFLVRAVLPGMVKRWNPDLVFSTSLFIAAVAYLTFPLFTSVTTLSMIALVMGLGLGCTQPITLMLIYSRAPEGRSGEALGMRITLNQITHIVVPIVFGTLGSALGIAPVFVANSLILAGAGLVGRRNRKASGSGDSLPHRKPESNQRSKP